MVYYYFMKINISRHIYNNYILRRYANELSKIFMTCNLVGGMYQRLEKLRKNAFASLCVFGSDDDNSISGVWFWRGHELAFPVRVVNCHLYLNV